MWRALQLDDDLGGSPDEVGLEGSTAGVHCCISPGSGQAGTFKQMVETVFQFAARDLGAEVEIAERSPERSCAAARRMPVEQLGERQRPGELPDLRLVDGPQHPVWLQYCGEVENRAGGTGDGDAALGGDRVRAQISLAQLDALDGPPPRGESDFTVPAAEARISQSAAADL